MSNDTDLAELKIRSQLAGIGLRWAERISWNANEAVLFQAALQGREGEVTDAGALSVSTGACTGRSPKDKFIVYNAASEHSVWWDTSQSLSQNQFDQLKADFLIHARLKSLHVQDLQAGADPQNAIPVRVITEHAWQALFIRHLLIKPQMPQDGSPQLHIICLPSFKADPTRHGTRSETVIAMDLASGFVLIGGTHYAGEIKKAVFTYLNHIMPDRQVLPMHCAANVGSNGDTAVFFGLSGTGKTTLSTDINRKLIGDDEHGWSERGIFNFEGGCYAKAINLSAENEPEIHGAANRWATVLENVTIDPVTRAPNYSDDSKTENTRLAYPLDAISNASRDGMAPHPKVIIMLTADAFGVLPPIARLSAEQAMYHYMSGYTAKLAGTERGIREPQATFSACFGAPFLTRHPSVYGAQLKDLMQRHAVPCYLLNTGWTGGAYGTGKRFPLAVTRKILGFVLSGAMAHTPQRADPNFGFAVPVAIEGVDPALLDPKKNWPKDNLNDSAAYDVAAKQLVKLFEENFRKFDVVTVGPAQMAAQ